LYRYMVRRSYWWKGPPNHPVSPSQLIDVSQPFAGTCNHHTPRLTFLFSFSFFLSPFLPSLLSYYLASIDACHAGNKSLGGGKRSLTLFTRNDLIANSHDQMYLSTFTPPCRCTPSPSSPSLPVLHLLIHTICSPSSTGLPLAAPRLPLAASVHTPGTKVHGPLNVSLLQSLGANRNSSCSTCTETWKFLVLAASKD